MKKLTAILLTLCVMSVAFIGCNDTASTTKTKTEKTTDHHAAEQDSVVAQDCTVSRVAAAQTVAREGIAFDERLPYGAGSSWAVPSAVFVERRAVAISRPPGRVRPVRWP